MTPLDGLIELLATLAIFLPLLWYLDRKMKQLIKKLKELEDSSIRG